MLYKLYLLQDFLQPGVKLQADDGTKFPKNKHSFWLQPRPITAKKKKIAGLQNHIKWLRLPATGTDGDVHLDRPPQKNAKLKPGRQQKTCCLLKLPEPLIGVTELA